MEEMDNSTTPLRKEVVPTGVNNTSIEFMSPEKHAQMLIEFTMKKSPFPYRFSPHII